LNYTNRRAKKDRSKEHGMAKVAGRTVWITGASSGIGRALALELGRRGAKLILSGRNHDALDAVAREIGGDPLVLPFEATDPAAVGAAVERALAAGPVDLLVNNAGVSQRSLIVDTDLAVYRTLMEVDFFAPLALTNTLLPHMIERGSGHIAIVSSLAGKIGTPLRSGYCAAKHACVGYFEALRAEVETAYGIGVTVILPGSVQTDVAVNALSASGQARGRTDANIAAGMPADQAAQIIADGLEAGQREIVVAEGTEAQALHLRTTAPDALFDFTAAEGKRLADSRAAVGADWDPDPAKVR
jgi:dehydrogenase/reductase SDR family member 7B